MRILTTICFVVLMTGCVPIMDSFTGFRQTSREKSEEQRLFVEGIDQIFRNQDPQILMQLKESYPDSQWTEMADAIMAQRGLIKHQQQKLDSYQNRLDKLSSDKKTGLMQEQINQCLTENKNLQKELDLSNERLEALRELSIELELKQP